MKLFRRLCPKGQVSISNTPTSRLHPLFHAILHAMLRKCRRHPLGWTAQSGTKRIPGPFGAAGGARPAPPSRWMHPRVPEAPAPARPNRPNPSPIAPCSLLRTLDHQIEAHLLHLQSFPHSFAKTPGVRSVRSFNLITSTCSPVTLLESTLVDVLRVGFLTEQQTEISRNRPPTTPVKSILTETAPVTTFRMNTYKKQGGGAAPPIVPPQSRASSHQCTVDARHNASLCCTKTKSPLGEFPAGGKMRTAEPSSWRWPLLPVLPSWSFLSFPSS